MNQEMVFLISTVKIVIVNHFYIMTLVLDVAFGHQLFFA